jgi:hypothetical protein
MSDFIPTNELDRALMAVQRSDAAWPDVYRQLIEGELWFLVKYHPEIEGEVLELKNGSPLPFALLADKEGAVVPLFSSEARLEEGLKKGRVPARTFSAGSMPAQQVLAILGQTKLRAVINKSCGTGQIIIPPDLMRDLASGKALAPLPLGQERHKKGVLKIINPADYPTDLIQPVFEFMRRHAGFRVAWIFDSSKVVDKPVAGRCYQFLFVMQPRDEVIFHDLNMTIQAARAAADEVGLGLLDETDENYIAKLFRQAPPFFKAPDYRPPNQSDNTNKAEA